MTLSDIISGIFGAAPPGLDPEMTRWLQQQQLMQAAAAMMKAGAPSSDPASKSLTNALSAGLAAGSRMGVAGLELKNRQDYYDYLRRKAEIDWENATKRPGAATPPFVPAAGYNVYEGNVPPLGTDTDWLSNSNSAPLGLPRSRKMFYPW